MLANNISSRFCNVKSFFKKIFTHSLRSNFDFGRQKWELIFDRLLWGKMFYPESGQSYAMLDWIVDREME